MLSLFPIPFHHLYLVLQYIPLGVSNDENNSGLVLLGFSGVFNWGQKYYLEIKMNGTKQLTCGQYKDKERRKECSPKKVPS